MRVADNDVLEVIAGYRHRHGYGPTVRELATVVGYKAVSTMQHHLDCLVRQGKLTRRPNTSRSLVPTT